MDSLVFIILIIISSFISIASIVIAIFSYFKNDILKKRLDMFMQGKDAESLEGFFIDIQKDIDHILEDNQKIKENIKKLNRITRRSFQKAGFYKYDAFDEKTGKRSFALALLDFTNTGYVFTCQNMGDSTIIFIKEIDGGATGTKLGPEEEKALEIAMGQREKNNE